MTSLALIVILTIFSNCRRMEYAIKGKVVDKNSKESVFPCDVKVVKSGNIIISTVVDFDGTFMLNPLTCRKCILIINAEGYKEKEMPIQFHLSEPLIIQDSILLEKK